MPSASVIESKPSSNDVFGVRAPQDLRVAHVAAGQLRLVLRVVDELVRVGPQRRTGDVVAEHTEHDDRAGESPRIDEPEPDVTEDRARTRETLAALARLRTV